MKQFIIHLNDKKVADKKFIIEDLDARHLLIKGEVKDEIERKVSEWMDEVCICIYFNVILLLFCMHAITHISSLSINIVYINECILEYRKGWRKFGHIIDMIYCISVLLEE